MTGRCRRVRIASTTRRSASSPRSRRSEILRKGNLDELARRSRVPAKLLTRAKYIEGLENRLGRMESLLKLSGLLSDEDNLGTLEKRLADKAVRNGDTPSRSSNRSASANPPRASTESHHNTPRAEVNSSPRSSMASPESHRAGEEEVEALSDMMCSLVTNNCGETRYIGRSSHQIANHLLTLFRIIVRLLNLLPERDPVGK